MSASPIARQACSHAQLIPAMRKVLISEPSQMPDVYSSTPNGTLYSTTPGGNNSLPKKTKSVSTLELLPVVLSHSGKDEKSRESSACCSSRNIFFFSVPVFDGDKKHENFPLPKFTRKSSPPSVGVFIIRKF